MRTPIRVAITGAAGNVGYALVFRIANGDLFGPDQPVILQMLEIPSAMQALAGVAMELDDCAFPLLADILLTDAPSIAFRDASWALLVGARPRGKGMKRGDLIKSNAPIFASQGKALNDNAAQDVRVLVVGNPANTNCLLALRNASDIPAERFSAMTRLDHNRALARLAAKAGVPVGSVKKVTIWGNHSSTQYPDAYHAEIGGEPAPQVIKDDAWIRDTFIPQVQGRGGAIIEARGRSSAASAANAAINHVQSWHWGTPQGDWVSMAILSTGAYGTPGGVVFSYPVRIAHGVPAVVEGLELGAFDREKIAATGAELVGERAAVRSLLP